MSLLHADPREAGCQLMVSVILASLSLALLVGEVNSGVCSDALGVALTQETQSGPKHIYCQINILVSLSPFL